MFNVVSESTKNFLGDWHCAYVLLYGPRLLKLPVDG